MPLVNNDVRNIKTDTKTKQQVLITSKYIQDWPGSQRLGWQDDKARRDEFD